MSSDQSAVYPAALFPTLYNTIYNTIHYDIIQYNTIIYTPSFTQHKESLMTNEKWG